MPELGIIFAPWDLPGMKRMVGRMLAGGIAAVALILLVDWRLDEPGPWLFVAAVVCGIACVAWALHGAMPEIRRMRAEHEDALQELLRSRGRR